MEAKCILSATVSLIVSALISCIFCFFSAVITNDAGRPYGIPPFSLRLLIHAFPFEDYKLASLTDPLYPTVWVLEAKVCKISRNRGNFRLARAKCFFYSSSRNQMIF